MNDSGDASPSFRQRAEALRRLTDAYFLNMTAAERDRLFQLHLAECRGRRLNARMLIQLTNSLHHARNAVKASERPYER